MHKLEYLWLDGCTPTQIRYKTKVVKEPLKVPEWGFDPIWGFDGSSTEQAEGGSSDCQLKPVRVYPNPLEEDSSIVLCEVYNVDDTPHQSNTRRLLEDTIPDGIDEWVGFEQEYTLFVGDSPLGWPITGEPAPQGDYYCGRNIGEYISREHLNACIKTGISICGTNAEVMLGQWEYQIGAGGSIHMSDDLWVARWLLERICEKHEVVVSLHPKPIEMGDLLGEIIAQIKEIGHEHREDSLHYFIYNTLPGTTSAAGVKAGFLKEIILGTSVVEEITPTFAFVLLSHMKGGPSVEVLLDLVLGPGSASTALSSSG